MFQSPEVFQLLSPYFDENYFQKQVGRLSGLPNSLKQIGFSLIGAQMRDQTSDHEQQQRLLRRALADLAVLSQPDRQRLFTALAPSISDQIEAAWQVFDHLPYSSGYNRRPFRFVDAPNSIESNMVRSIWVHRLIQAIKGYEQPVTWFAIWASYLGYGVPDALGPLFAGAIDQGGTTGQEVFDILTTSALGDHPTGKMGRHVVRALLCASRSDGWEFIEHLLLAAQREEGLRQVVMEAVDEAHPDAFLRILHVVIEQNLIRFSGVVRAAAVWVGLPFEAEKPKTILDVLTKLRDFLDKPETGQAVLSEGIPEDQYLALWAIAYQNVAQALVAAQPLLRHAEPDHRFAAVYFLGQTQLAKSEQSLLPLIDDNDLRVAISAYAGVAARGMVGKWYVESDLFESVESLISRLPERTKTLKPIIWDWITIQIDRKAITDVLVNILGVRSPNRLLPYLDSMSSIARVNAANLFVEHIYEDPKYREALFVLAADRDSYVHERIFTLLEKIQPRLDEILQLESLLTRKTTGLRRGVIGLLLHQSDSDLLASIDRLLNKKDEQQHLAGVELLREMAQANRDRKECQLRVARLESEGISDNEKNMLADLVSEDPVVYSLSNALGLASLRNLSRPVEPHSKRALFGLIKNVHLGSAAAAACIQALDDLIDHYRTEPIDVNDWRNETRTELLGNAHWGLISPDPDLSIEENRKRFPLAVVWEKWWQERPKSQRDEDGLELFRAQAALSLLSRHRSAMGEWTQIIPKESRTYLDESYDFHLKYEIIVDYILRWLIYLYPVHGTVDFLLDAVEETFYRFRQHPLKESPIFARGRWQISPSRLGYLKIAREYRRLHKGAWTAAQQTRLWGMIRWLEWFISENGGHFRPQLDDVLLAYEADAATQDDLIMFLMGIPEEKGLDTRLRHLVANNFQVYTNQQQFTELRQFSGKHPHPIFNRYSFFREAIELCRNRILEIELWRGDLPTAASAPALALRSVPGAISVVQLLSALGKSDFERGYSFSQNRLSVLSHLIRVSYPLETDTPESFADLVNNAHISDHRLVELAVFAPQWSKYVEHTLGWHGMVEAVWWVYAHTKDRQWSVDADIRESWSSQIAEYTPLSANELLDGAVDVNWFQRMYAELGERRWQEIYRVALYAASGSGHARARLFSDALLGKLTTDELIDRVKSKRHQDAVRALGLIPLSLDASRQSEILRRYEVMQEFLRTSKQFGSQRQASEKLAASVGMENLARTAGYADPQRLEWSMELEAISDLATGSVSVQVDDVSVTLTINNLGETELSVQRGERILKSLPPAVKKNVQISAFVARKQSLEQQARRMRSSLETAMIRGDTFNGAELNALLGHPILRVMLEQLIFVGPAGMGYLIDRGEALDSLGKCIPLTNEDRLYIAHSFDLLQSGCWHDWQHECFIAERIQPVKQVFRELYIPTETEYDENNFSRRYAGQQVNPRQAIALFGTRDWVTASEEGVFKTFHSEGIVARVGFMQAFYTPAEVEGLTIETVGFTRRGEWLPIKLDQVPPRLFSEVMRDLDLVVSVAHASGVDPEASASTVEARASLVQETCTLLNLANVHIENRHALVNGSLGNYTIHLGSGIVHKQPGGALCIVPVHSQYRGRLFLPFVDKDPKTAEIISKVLLFAKDQDIKDPTIIEQILH